MKRIIFAMLILLVATSVWADSVIIPAPQYGEGAYIVVGERPRGYRQRPAVVIPQQPICPTPPTVIQTPGYTPYQPNYMQQPSYSTQPNNFYQYDYGTQKSW